MPWELRQRDGCVPCLSVAGLSPAARVFARIGLILLYFVIVTVLSSAVEFITGLIFEKGFGVTL